MRRKEDGDAAPFKIGINLRMSREPAGSTPAVGSSSTTSFGSLISALSETNPLQHSFRVSAQSLSRAFVRPTSSSSSRTRLFSREPFTRQSLPKNRSVLFAGEKFIEIRIFRQESNGLAAFHERTVASKDFCSSARSAKRDKNNFSASCFCPNVRPEQSVNFACLDAQIEIAYGRDRFSTKGDLEKLFVSPSTATAAPASAPLTPWQISHGKCRSRAPSPVRPAPSAFALSMCERNSLSMIESRNAKTSLSAPPT